MKKYFLAVIVLVSTLVHAQDNKTQVPPNVAVPVENKNAPDIKFEVEEYNFGTIKQGDKVTYDFSFINSGKEALIISNAQGSCGCTVPEWPKEAITKGNKGSIHVEFNSTGKMGMQDKTVTITSNAKSGPKTLHLKGNVEAPETQPPADNKQ